uniref:Uncharacterized protein n=1 Tax=Theileria annulata TaxID=5874 RepID=A0A3B0N1I4_THEAN
MLKSLIRRPDLHKGKLVGGFSFLMFALPTSAMLLLPPLARFFGFGPTLSMLTGVTTSVVMVIGLTLLYAWIAYKTDDSSEHSANFILKSTKID